MTTQAMLDRASPVPLYHQLERILRTQLAEARFQPGDLLPTEEQLTQTYGISRSTARQALGRLQQDGLVERRPARGTRVAERPFTEPFAWLDSYVLKLVAEGRAVHTRFLGFETTTAPRAVTDALGLPSGERFHVVRRLTFVDDAPQNLATTYVREASAPAFALGDLSESGPQQSAYYVLKMRHGLTLSDTEIDVEPHALSAAEARHLGKAAGTPAICRCRNVYGRDRTPLLHDHAVFTNGFRLLSPAPTVPLPHGGPA